MIDIITKNVCLKQTLTQQWVELKPTLRDILQPIKLTFNQPKRWSHEDQVGGEELGEKPYWVISTFCQDDSEESDPCEEA